MDNPIAPAGVVVEEVLPPAIACYIIGYRKPTHSTTQPYVNEYFGCADMVEVEQYAQRMKLTEEQFLGVWELGEPLALTLATTTETVSHERITATLVEGK
jgi:hypothetical protein